MQSQTSEGRKDTEYKESQERNKSKERKGKKGKVCAGSAAKLGPRFVRREKKRGINFAVFSTAEEVFLELFRNVTDEKARRSLKLRRKPDKSGTGYIHHLFVPGLGNRTLYNFRIGETRLLDPYARAHAGKVEYHDGAVHVPRCVVFKDSFDWQGDTPLSWREGAAADKRDVVIYEVLVGGFTSHHSSGCNGAGGTFRGMLDKIGHLKALGVTAVELMPIFDFDPFDCVFKNPFTGEALTNAWGYNTVGFFAPDSNLASWGRLGEQIEELKLLVRELHKQGIEVVLDVVLNHTREGNHLGPVLSFKGLANEVYYMLHPDGSYNDWTGCGNTINTNHPVVRRFILDCLRYWVEEFHIDGFRFDLAAVFAVDVDQQEKREPTPLIREMETDPVLSKVRWWIAEPWGPRQHLLHNGPFSRPRWCRWNDTVRDTIRRWVKGDEGMLYPLQEAIAGSEGDIIFVTCHDGFTLYDLVCNNDRHNWDNGDSNRDGTNNNHSWNCGYEGRRLKPSGLAEPERRAIWTLRRQQMKNLLSLLFLGKGTPMVLFGDEFCRSAEGNNNMVFQEEKNALRWNLAGKYEDICRFLSGMIALRARHRLNHRHIRWLGTTPDSDAPGWSRTLAMLFEPGEGTEQQAVYVVTNAYWEQQAVRMPNPPAGSRWHRLVDTSLPTGQDLVPEEESTPLGLDYLVNARSTVILLAR